MFSSDVDVANAALVLLGESHLTTLDENTDRGRAIKRNYTLTLEEALRCHDWNFARMRANLARLTAVPEFGYSYMYQLPQDPLCLRVLQSNLSADEPWEIETYRQAAPVAEYRVIVTDATAIEIRYIAKITNPALWDSLFTDAFVHELARRAAYPITRNATLVETLRQETEARWRAARSVDGQESRALRQFLSGSFTDVR